MTIEQTRAPGLRRGLALLLAALATASCAATNREVIAGLAPAYRDKRAELARIARELPPRGSVRKVEIPASLDPPIVIEQDTPNINTDVLPIELLVDPDAKGTSHGPLHDFWIYPNNLIYCLGWTGPHNPLDEGLMDSAAGEALRRCQQTLRQPYVLAVRTVRYDVPDAVALEAFLVDLRSGRILGQFPMSFRNPSPRTEAVPDLSVASYRAGIADAFSEIMHCGLVTALQRFPGARIRVRRTCEPSAPVVRFEPLTAEPTMAEPAAAEPAAAEPAAAEPTRGAPPMILAEPPANGERGVD